ncbi:MAG: hypothetical protein KGM17_05435 [Sphingomonadales bacterium]|nr:hypothetical protein [Sphingomonadales bacterium]
MSDSAERGFADWLIALQVLAENLVAEDPSEDEGFVARLITVIDTAPIDLAMPFGVHGNAAALRAAVGPDSLETVMLRVIGDRTGFMISRGVQGLHYVTIAIPDHDVEVSAEGGTFARACCKAVVLAIMALLQVHPAG